MNSAPPTATPRRVWRWILLGLGLCLTPLVILAIVAASFLTLERNAAVLRQQVMAATATEWRTKVQLDVGGLTIGAIRTGLAFVHHNDVADAKLALAAVSRASVGVYERSGRAVAWSRPHLFVDTDELMQRRGWSRLVGVADEQDTVLIYVPQNLPPDGPVELCLAVVSGAELVVVSTKVDAAKLVELAAAHGGAELQHARLRFTGLRF